MSKFELSISTSYVPKWGLVEAIRELTQNALDVTETEKGGSYKLTYNETTQVLSIVSYGGTLTPDTLLLGKSTKADEEKAIGQYGEGYKIAVLVLLRSGYNVVFDNLSLNELWTPRLVNSRKYGATVPVFETAKRSFASKSNCNGLAVTVWPITKEQIKLIAAKNLVIANDLLDIHTEGPTVGKYGRILTEDCYKGQIFVRGLYVCTEPRLMYGYDFNPDVISLDRDRSLVSCFDLHRACSKMIAEMAMEHGEEGLKLARNMIGTDEAEYLSWYLASSSEGAKKLSKSLYDAIKKEHGEDAVPVSSTYEYNVLQNAGKNAVLVKPSVQDVIKRNDEVAEEIDSAVHKAATSPACGISIYQMLKNAINQLWSSTTYDNYETVINLLDAYKDRLDFTTTKSETEEGEQSES